MEQNEDQVAAIAIYTNSGNPPFFNQTAFDKTQNYPNSGGTPLLWSNGNRIGWTYSHWVDSVNQYLGQASDVNLLLNGSLANNNSILNLNIRLINESGKEIKGRLHVVITEDSLYWEAQNTQNIHNHVPRIWWPNANGNKTTIPPSGELEESVQLSLENTWDFHQLKIIVFLQAEDIVDDQHLPILQGAQLKISEIITSIEENDIVIENFKLYQNYPNPFNPQTVIPYQLQVNSNVEISIYNSLGQKAEILYSGLKTAGRHKIEWQPANLPSGIYYYRLKVNRQYLQKKMLLIR